MIRILEFVRSGGGLTEDELAALIKERMLRIPVKTQRNWLRQLILALDGYGGEQQLSAAERVKDAVIRLDAGLAPEIENLDASEPDGETEGSPT
jgi:hypothetical protein